MIGRGFLLKMLASEEEFFRKREIARGCWYLTGATAGGKTDLALEIASRLNAEIISLDSMAIYNGMDIGTAKPSLDAQKRIKHHLVDVIEPDQDFSVSQYCDKAFEVIDLIRETGKNVLFVGGTALYLKSLIRGAFAGPPANWEFRNAIQDELEEVGTGPLFQRLESVDPLSAHKLHPNDVRRIVRALEVYHETGQPISHLQVQFEEGESAERSNVFAIRWPREVLHQRIDQRIDQMFASEFVKEVSGLRERYDKLSTTALQAVGYREVLDYLDQGSDLNNVIELVKYRTHQFARHQETWFRGLSEVTWLDRAEGQSNDAHLAEILSKWG
jgi:tRNA dimethylallyltransferase